MSVNCGPTSPEEVEAWKIKMRETWEKQFRGDAKGGITPSLRQRFTEWFLMLRSKPFMKSGRPEIEEPKDYDERRDSSGRTTHVFLRGEWQEMVLRRDCEAATKAYLESLK